MGSSATGNTILDAMLTTHGTALSGLLADARCRRFADHELIQSADQPVTRCYFPVRGVLTLESRVEDVAVHTMMVGFDGAVHASLGINLSRAPDNVVSWLHAEVWEVDAAAWHALLDDNRAARRIAASFTDSELRRAQRSRICEMRHDVESRFCRVLAELNVWQRGEPLAITHQRLSELLGVRRTTITLIAKPLQEAGIISYRRGILEITDPYALHQASCTCHKVQQARAPLPVQ